MNQFTDEGSLQAIGFMANMIFFAWSRLTNEHTLWCGRFLRGLQSEHSVGENVAKP